MTGRRRRDEEDRAYGASRDRFGNTAREQSIQAAAAVRRHHDHLCSDTPARRQDRNRRIAKLHPRGIWQLAQSQRHRHALQIGATLTYFASEVLHGRMPRHAKAGPLQAVGHHGKQRDRRTSPACQCLCVNAGREFPENAGVNFPTLAKELAESRVVGRRRRGVCL